MDTEDKLDLTTREPYGVSGQIIPWNFPLSITVRGVAPALVAGSTVVVKSAPTTPLSALHLGETCADAGVPESVINVVPGGAEPSVALSSHDDVDQLTFTGSVYVNEWFGGSTETPFGGMKKSGIGREKGLEALGSYLQTKNISVNLDERNR